MKHYRNDALKKSVYYHGDHLDKSGSKDSEITYAFPGEGGCDGLSILLLKDCFYLI